MPTLPGVVTRVIDGDTLDVRLDSGSIRVRLHAIDTPERAQPWGREAAAALAALVAGKHVELEPFEQDAYDRLVARVFLDGIDVNGVLVDHGHAWAFRRYMTRDDAAYCTLEDEARIAGRGLWTLPAEQRIAPWEWRHRSAATDYSFETAENCIAAIGAQGAGAPSIQPFAAQPTTGAPKRGTAEQAFTCGAKTYCSEMASCAEARFHLASCGLTRIDGDGDGIPCEKLCQ